MYSSPSTKEVNTIGSFCHTDTMPGMGITLHSDKDLLRLGTEETRDRWNILLFTSGVPKMCLGDAPSEMDKGLYIAPFFSLPQSLSPRPENLSLLSIPFPVWDVFDGYNLSLVFSGSGFVPYIHLDDCDAEMVKHMFSIIKDVLDTEDSPHKSMELSCLCRGLIASIKRFYSKGRHPIVWRRGNKTADTFMSLVSRYGSREHQLEFYAENMGITTKYLTSVISRITGKRATQWISDNVIMNSKRLLEQSSCQIQEIAIQMGFKSASDFSKYFHKQTGTSPLQYRKMTRMWI